MKNGSVTRLTVRGGNPSIDAKTLSLVGPSVKSQGIAALLVQAPSRRFVPAVEEMQNVCLEVRKRNCGVNGKPVLFYSRRLAPNPIPSKVRNSKLKPDDNEILSGVRALGLTSATAVQVGLAVKELFPQGTSAVDQGEVIRAVFIHLKRQNSGDNVGR
jgi:hypothetical protein